MPVTDARPSRAGHPWVSITWPGRITDAHLHVGEMPMFGVNQASGNCASTTWWFVLLFPLSAKSPARGLFAGRRRAVYS